MLLTVGVLGLSPGRALADRAARSDVAAEARRLAEAGQLGEARELLEAELERAPTASLAFNLAIVEKGSARLQAAEALFVALLAGEYGDLPEARRERASQLLAETLASMATLTIRWRGALAATVRVNGVPRGELVRGESLRIRLDPGTHVVTARTSSGEAVSTQVELATGESDELRLDSLESEAPTAPRAGPGRSRRGLRIGVAIGVIVAVGAVSLALGFALREDDPVPDDFLGTVRF